MTDRTRDAYDEAVDYLTAAVFGMTTYQSRAFLECVWNAPYECQGGCLFAYTSPDDSVRRGGCLTQVKSGQGFGPRHKPGGQELLQRILQDDRIPSDSAQITPASLEAFAEYQREIDRMLVRQPLWWDAIAERYVRRVR